MKVMGFCGEVAEVDNSLVEAWLQARKKGRSLGARHGRIPGVPFRIFTVDNGPWPGQFDELAAELRAKYAKGVAA